MVRKRKCVEWKPVKSRKPSLFNRRVGSLMRNEGLTLGQASKRAATGLPPAPPKKDRKGKKPMRPSRPLNRME